MSSTTFTLILLSAAVAVLAALTLLFAAVALLLRWLNLRTARRWHGLELRWEGLLLDVLAGEAEPDTLRTLVQPSDEPYFVHFLLRFLRRLRGAERDRVVAVAQPHLPAIARRVRSRSAERRARAVQTLSLLGGEPYREAVQRALDDPSPLVVMVAARALARRRDPHHSAAILARLDEFRTWRPRYLAAMLAAMGSEATGPLRATLADPGRAPWVRAVAADALLTLNDLEAADPAAALLAPGSDRELLAACLRLLARLGRPEHLPAVRRLADAADPLVRAMAVRAIGGLAGPGDVAPLTRALTDDSPWVALEAARGLAHGPGAGTLAALAAGTHPRAELAREALLEAAP